MTRIVMVVVALVACLPLRAADAHRLHPALLHIDLDTAPAEVTWKRPLTGDVVAPLTPILPSNCTSSALRKDRTATVESHRFHLDCNGPFDRSQLGVTGLDKTGGEAIVRLVERGSTTSQTLTQHQPVWRADAGSNLGWFVIGIEHIVFGFDHLAFVFGLLLLTTGLRRTAIAVTAFTLGHSVTLAASALEIWAVNITWIETMIALSIVLMALEITRGGDGLVSRLPWLASLGCGLLHGFGFAGALGSLELPEADVVWALVQFNLGVEVGQLAFIALVLGCAALARAGGARVGRDLPDLRWGAGYALGVLAMMWTFERAAELLRI